VTRTRIDSSSASRLFAASRKQVSLLQRRLRLGYGRAARIMDELENRGIVGPSKGAEPRDILIDLDNAPAEGTN